MVGWEGRSKWLSIHAARLTRADSEMIHNYHWAVGYSYEPGPISAPVPGGICWTQLSGRFPIYGGFRVHAKREFHQELETLFATSFEAVSWDGSDDHLIEQLELVRHRMLESEIISWSSKKKPRNPVKISVGGIAIHSPTRVTAFRRGAFSVRVGSQVVLKGESLGARVNGKVENHYTYAASGADKDLLDHPLGKGDFVSFVGTADGLRREEQELGETLEVKGARVSRTEDSPLGSQRGGGVTDSNRVPKTVDARSAWEPVAHGLLAIKLIHHRGKLDGVFGNEPSI